jgi:hypothetical protein
MFQVDLVLSGCRWIGLRRKAVIGASEQERQLQSIDPSRNAHVEKPSLSNEHVAPFFADGLGIGVSGASLLPSPSAALSKK